MTTLIAVSGGLDSMVLLHRLQLEHGVGRIGVAHVNYGLRGEESDGDEAHVRVYCSSHGIRFHVKRVEMEKETEARSEGLQEAARNVRYEWFFDLMEEYNYGYLAIAHHSDDAIETFFINLLRGSGPEGLSGIQEDEERSIIRPLLDMDRVAIQSYAEEHGIQWRRDSSNDKPDYLRNRIRLELLPLLNELRPGFDKAMRRNMKIQCELAGILDTRVEAYRETQVRKENERLRIVTTGEQGEASLLHQILRPYGFSTTQVWDITEPGQSGRQIFSTSHMVTSHRGSLILDPLVSADEQVVISSIEEFENYPVIQRAELLSEAPQDFDPDPKIAHLDADLPFPWTLRPWRAGDRFQPLGMQGTKTISDFLTDLQMDRVQKAQTLVLIIEGRIAWVLGLRISEGHKAIAGRPCWRLALA